MTVWAATNTLRDNTVTLHYYSAKERHVDGADCPACSVTDEALAALALVETALDAAAEDLREDGYPVDDPDLDGRDDPQFKDELVRQWGAKKVALAAALRAVREGA